MKTMLAVIVLAWMTAACDKGQPATVGDPPAVAAAPATTEEPKRAKPATFRYGDKVKAQWTNGKWYSGTLTAVYSDGTADVRYDDGDRSKGLPFAKIELVKRPMFEVEATQ